MQWLTYSFDDDITDVVLVLSEKWPDVTVRLIPRGRGIEIKGVIGQDGRIRSFAIEAEGAGDEVTASAVRSLPALVAALKEWNGVAREMAEQFLEHGEDARPVVDAKPATDTLRALLYGVTARPPGKRKRGADAEFMLRQVVAAYKAALAADDPTPRKTVAEQFSYTPEHISRLLKRAREPRNGRPPLLGPSEGSGS